MMERRRVRTSQREIKGYPEEIVVRKEIAAISSKILACLMGRAEILR
jgi:hypothetical protein